MLDAAPDGLKVWLPGPLEAQGHHTSLGSKGPPGFSTDNTPYVLKTSNVFLTLATKLTLTDTVRDRGRLCLAPD